MNLVEIVGSGLGAGKALPCFRLPVFEEKKIIPIHITSMNYPPNEIFGSHAGGG